MRYILTIRDGFVEFEFGRIPLTEVGISGDFGLVRGDMLRHIFYIV